jgi:hypothetical protein
MLHQQSQQVVEEIFSCWQSVVETPSGDSKTQWIDSTMVETLESSIASFICRH